MRQRRVDLLEELDLEITLWQDATRTSLDWFAANAPRLATSAAGLRLLMPADYPAMAANVIKNLTSSALAVIQVVATRT